MRINEVVLSIPSLISSLFDDIVVIDQSESVYYSVNYTGEKIKVSSKNDISSLSNKFSKNIIDIINENDEIKTFFDGFFISIFKIENYKLVLFSNTKKENISDNRRVILIADDSPVITKFFTRTFKDEFEILVAKDGNEAIELVEQNKDRLLGAFLDLQMPKKNGYEVLDYFSENDLFKNIPVSIISGEDTKDGIESATSIPGVVDMLQKPFNAESARAIVNKTISFSPKYKEF
ncbi:MAG: response regulator [Bacilli bacterium]|nr:response regulator [Bacilli bacterium]